MTAPPPLPPERAFVRLTWTEVDAMPQRERVVLVQHIASIEQHGPHLPLDTDTVIGEAVLGAALARLEESMPVLVMPTLPYGKSNEHMGFPGTVTLGAATLLAALGEIAEGLPSAGFRRLVLYSAHGGNRPILEIAARDLRARHGSLSVFPMSLWQMLPPDPSVPAQRLDLHAGDAETSLMLAIRPESVRQDAAISGFPPASLIDDLYEGGVPIAWISRDLTKSGVIGDARAASREKGERLLDLLADRLAHRLRAIHRLGED